MELNAEDKYKQALVNIKKRCLETDVSLILFQDIIDIINKATMNE